MSEYPSGRNNIEQEALPTLSLEEVIANMPIEERVEAKRRWLDEISDREKLCRLVDEANEHEGADITIIY